MSTDNLEQMLKALMQEIEQIDSLSAEDKNKLETTVADIQARLQGAEQQHTELSDSISDSITQFETSYPRLTAILNDIMVKLSSMGI